MKKQDVFDSISPIDYRYPDKEVVHYLSENGFTRYKLLVEIALIKTLHKRGICGADVIKEVELACEKVTTEDIYDEEGRIKHDIRALVNCIRDKISKAAKRFVHMMATSFDISDTANAARYKDVTKKILLPKLIKLARVLIEITKREAETKQIGRTHGQHAVPITFGFAIAEYVSRLGKCILSLDKLSDELVGKFSGAVGGYNASSLFFDDPEVFEQEILAELGLKPADHSTQIVQPEPLIRLLCEVVTTAGVLANLSRDMRNLQRTEIGEVGEAFEGDQVGSSTMPQKRNPINFENAESFYTIVMPRIITVFMNQISEHQRDLTNSASARTYGEIFAYVASTAERLTRTMKKLQVDKDNLQRNLAFQQDLIIAEPLYIILAAMGHPDAHEKVRLLTLQAQQKHKPLEKIAIADKEIAPYFEKMTPYQRKTLSNPSTYTGISVEKAKKIAAEWTERLKELEQNIGRGTFPTIPK
ncbi:adenylosuccinate lyase [Candidatus Parcubacteria bacterium]|nr:adenylosuccinate lyase [Candidatus Parcubacteria bacterium]